MAAKSRIKKIENLQSVILRDTLNVPWCVRNDDIKEVLKISTAKDEIRRYLKKKTTPLRDKIHTNQLAKSCNSGLTKKLRRKHLLDLLISNK